MDIKTVEEITRMQERRPGDDKSELKTDSEKLSELGSRIAAITSPDPNKDVGYREFVGLFMTDDGKEGSLTITTRYANSLNVLQEDQCIAVYAVWKMDNGGTVIKELGGEETLRDYTPEQKADLFIRLEESVTAAEELYAHASEPTPVE